jgi:hypothetical protein
MVKNTIILIRKQMNFGVNTHRKQTENIRNEIAQLQLSIKEMEQENKINAEKTKELRPLVKHNQLLPIKGKHKKHVLSPEPISTKFS